LILRTQNTIISTQSTVQETKFGVLAVSLATSLIEEANRKSFDQNTDGFSLNDPNLLSHTLNNEDGEAYSDFNDFDDFNNFDTTITNLPSADFNLHCEVFYVSDENPEIPENNPTWTKKLTVSVSSPFSQDTIRLSSIFSYFYFN